MSLAGPRFDNSYARLPEPFHSAQLPTPVRAPRLIRYNVELAAELGISDAWLTSPEGVAVLAGNATAPGSQPIATVYAGHQFGGWNPRLGDGRAILLGEVIDNRGERRDLQLKGAGRTPYSRGGDGRSPLGPTLREYIVSEAMAALGVPTTRSLAAIATGEPVHRERALPGGVLTRVAASHIRVGTFQYFWAREEHEAVRQLADHVIARHFRELTASDNPYLALLQAVVARQAQLVAQWLQFGFIHGVMNTDNMLISGETIDYGPCAFLDRYHPQTVFSSIDSRGRYAYANQPGIAQWNLAWFAQALLPLLADDEEQALAAAQEAISSFKPAFDTAHETAMHRKLGLQRCDEESRTLQRELFDLMTAEGADFTLTFRHLTDLACSLEGDQSVRELGGLPDTFASWLLRWQARLAQEAISIEQRRALMLAANPVFIPRNHLVEAAIEAAYQDDFAPFHALVERLAEPWHYTSADRDYARPPRPEEEVTRTFCGT